MKLHYDVETDSLYIELSAKPGTDADEVAPGIVLDFDSARRVVGIDIQRASEVVDLTRLESDRIPIPMIESSSAESTPKSG